MEKKIDQTIGKCRQCSFPISMNSRVLCEVHLDMARKRSRLDRERRRSIGMCRSCKDPISPNSKTWCAKHQEMQNKSSKEWAKRAREMEFCVDCRSESRIARRKRCEQCQEAFDQKKLTLCRRSGCDSPIAEGLKYFCRPHGDEENEKLKNRRQKMKEDRVCIFCFSKIGDEEPKTHVLCAGCRSRQKDQRRASTGS